MDPITYRVSQFSGINTEVKDVKTLPRGMSPDSLNWITSVEKDAITLRRGSALLGQTRNSGIGKITGLGIATKFNGVQVPIFSYGRKVMYYDADDDDTHENGTDLLPAAADGEDVSIESYQNLGGSWIFASSPNSSIYKIASANPGYARNLNSTTYRGWLKFGQNAAFLFDRNGATAGNNDKTGLYRSWIDKVSLADYPAQITGEVVGILGSQNYTHTLTQITGVRTAMFVQVQATVAAGTETFVDDRNGNLVSNFGGEGTVNYITGEIEVNFSDITTGAVSASYYYEDSTDEGVADFSFTSPTRVPGEGNYYPQFDGGGNLNAIYPLATVFYSFHERKTWQTAIPSDDGADGSQLSINLPFRDKMGVKSKRGAYGGVSGIYYVNTADPNRPTIETLSLFTGATQANIAYPKLISEALDLSGYAFDYAVVFEWGIYVLVCCQQIRNGVADDFNSRTFVYNKKNGIWDLTDIAANCFANYDGVLLGGDSISNNVFTLFSGFDDDNNLIPNYWKAGQSDLEMEGQKRFTRMVFDGLIQGSQNLKVSLSFDGGAFVDVFTISGTGDYVDTGRSVAVGSYTLGSRTVGGGGGEVFANPYHVEFLVQSPRFEYVQVKIEATGGGFCQVNYYEFKDIRRKSLKSLPTRIAS